MFLHLGLCIANTIFFSLDVRMANSEDEACTQAAANNLEAFRRIAQAHAERERFLPGAPNVMMNNPLAQNLTATASDYMRLAMPVRDPDNGDAISGSGKLLGTVVMKIKC